VLDPCRTKRRNQRAALHPNCWIPVPARRIALAELRLVLYIDDVAVTISRPPAAQARHSADDGDARQRSTWPKWRKVS
jgi:hypothetical protein